MSRIFLSPPDVGPADRDALLRAFDGGWIAPLGPEVDAFEAELATVTGRDHAVALSSGTAALHLALLLAGVGPGDKVLVSTLTFAATANAVRYTGAEPVFVDSDHESWNLDPDRLAEALA
jgi:dTDP-4-amino-4,6-dideoxygalactose transaminase